MGTVSNALNMLFILSSGKTYKIRELAEKLEVSPKSVRLYRDALDEAGVYVLEKRGKYGGYHLPKDFQNSLLGLEMTEEEKLALELVEGELQSAGHLEARNIGTLLVEQMSHIVSGARPNIDASKEREKLIRIIRAKREKRKVCLQYRSLRGETNTRTLHVYNTYTYRGEIYLVAYCEMRKGYRDFKLSRAFDVQLLDDTFNPDKDFSVAEYMKDCIGIFKGEALEVILQIKEPLAQVVRETIYTENQEIEELPQGGIRFKATMRGRQEIVSWILSLGPSAEVLEPAGLKEEIVRMARGICAQYEVSHQ